MLTVTPALSIPEWELHETFARSSGPGGQNVNKVETAVCLRFDVRRSPSLPDSVRHRLERLSGQRLTRDGILVITADRFRQQERNRADARDRLAGLIRAATHAPPPRKPTRPTRAAKERRLAGKVQRSRVKVLRRRPGRADRDDSG